ncbi:MAG: hypothetical protein WEE20_08185 [Bacteroidota bacterium]
MRFTLMTSLALLLALLLVPGCTDNTNLTGPEPQQEVTLFADMSLAFVMASDSLDLTPEQREKLEAALKQFRQDVEAAMRAHKSGGMTREEFRARVSELENRLDAEVRAILTPEQYDRWKNRQREIKDQGGVPYPLIFPLDRLARLLELTPDQVAQAEVIVHDAQMALRHAVETIHEREKLREAIESIFKRADARFQSLLSRGQLAKYNDLKSRRAQPKLPYPLPSRLDQLARLLSLTPDQLEKARAIVRGAEGAIRQAVETQTDKKELRTTVGNILKRAESAFRSILTPEQVRLYEQWKQRGKGRG